MQVSTLLERVLFVTVRITTTSADGSSGLGTAFAYATPIKNSDGSDGGTGMVLVTNKHVVQGKVQAVLHFIASTDDGASPKLGEEVAVTVDPGSFIGHPNPSVDVAVLPVGGLMDHLEMSGRAPFLLSVESGMAATPEKLAEYEPIEPVTFIGYPNGLYDSASLLPIVRRGHSATALTVDYEGEPVFLIDASVFPGSSGSPVFLIVPASTADKFGNITFGGGPKVVFLGIVAAVYQRTVSVLHAALTGDFVQDALDIGVVYKASTIVGLVEDVIRQQAAHGT